MAMAGFSEIQAPWLEAAADQFKAPRELWGALKGTVRIPPGGDITAPLDEDWDAAR